jgi:hypothetical protein
MSWHLLAGVAQVALIVAFVVTQRRARRPAGEVGVAAVAMGLLAVGTFAGARWAIVVAGVFYAVWLLDQLFVWIRPTVPVRRSRSAPAPRRLDHALLGAISVIVLTLTWFAVSAPVWPR